MLIKNLFERGNSPRYKVNLCQNYFLIAEKVKLKVVKSNLLNFHLSNDFIEFFILIQRINKGKILVKFNFFLEDIGTKSKPSLNFFNSGNNRNINCFFFLEL